MKYGCPYKTCSFQGKNDQIRKDGTYWRSNDSRRIQRYKCLACKKRFSSSTHSLAYKQKKRRVNFPLRKLLCSGVSMRRAARLLNIHRTTVKRKLIYLAKKARVNHLKFLKLKRKDPSSLVFFDDLITIEHTKLKPLSISLFVDGETSQILASKVSRIPAFGHLAALSREKYGKRPSQHRKGLESAFKIIKDSIYPEATFKTDEHKTYPEFIKKYFPSSTHRTYKSSRGSIAGQGELKKVVYDPLFPINHACAKLRADINRLFRRTWCSTKDPDKLQDHLDMYVEFHNTFLLN